MQRAFKLFCLLCVCCLTVGCAVCQSPYDYDYAAHGGCCCGARRGCWRVGSLFGPAPADASLLEPSATFSDQSEGEEILLPEPVEP